MRLMLLAGGSVEVLVNVTDHISEWLLIAATVLCAYWTYQLSREARREASKTELQKDQEILHAIKLAQLAEDSKHDEHKDDVK